MQQTTESIPGIGIKIIAIINGLAALLHLVFWIFVYIKMPSISSPESLAEQINLATIYGFGLADIVWSVPFLLLGSILLRKGNLIGWMCAYFANVLYWYSFTIIMLRDNASGSLSPGSILFLPFVLFSFWAAYHLWKVRASFLL